MTYVTETVARECARLGGEVLSPSTRIIDWTRKLPIYHHEGVAHAWLVEPLARTLDA